MNVQIEIQAKAGGSLRDRIAQLRAQHRIDILAGLRELSATESTLFDELGAALGLPVVRETDWPNWVPRFDLLAFQECIRHQCGLASGDPSDVLHLIVADPFDTNLVGWARTRFGPLQVALAVPKALEAWLRAQAASMSALNALEINLTTGPTADEGVEAVSLLSATRDDSPAVRFVNSTLYDALQAGASDIHFETDAAGAHVKFRLDGVLTPIRHLESLELATQAISRIKVMAQLDIAERRVPQDGRLQIRYESRVIDVRVSVMPSIHGEDAVLRILDRQSLAKSQQDLTLARLGFQDALAESVRRLCRKPHGMFLVTGPTGSGKTTTLYAAISETHLERDKVITIEDPVEYQLPGILQIPVNERKGLTFARGLRSILRHDPDKILVGEIRDGETAQIAIQSALTGHLVFTSVHANSAIDVIGRFEQFGIDAYALASAVNGVLAQRLIRKLCAVCAVPSDPPQHWRDDQDFQTLSDRDLGTPRVRTSVGCPSCRGTGFSGRIAVGELLVVNDEVRSLLGEKASALAVRQAVERSGFLGLRAQAMAAAWTGLTTPEEVERVAG